MKNITFYTVGTSTALIHARNLLSRWGYNVSQSMNESITHILLPVPSLDENNKIRGGPFLEEILCKTPKNTTIMGGLLPELKAPSVDFLKDAYYVAENASITAHCAVKIILQNTEYTLKGIPILIIGWGRIGKCLAQLLQAMGANITVAVRKKEDCAILRALGYQGILLNNLKPEGFRVTINTVPAPVLKISQNSENTIYLDLASSKGIDGSNVMWKRGLPGTDAPESSGLLIAKTALRYALGKE